MTTLSRLLLDPVSPVVRAELADAHRLHGRVMGGFPPDAGGRAASGILYRLDEPSSGRPTLLVQSAAQPAWEVPEGYLSAPPEQKQLETFLAEIVEGNWLRFRLLANVTRKIDTKSRPDGARSNGRRVELRDDGGRLNWLSRKAGECGFFVDTAAVYLSPQPSVSGRRKGRGIAFRGVRFDGVLRVTDPEHLREAVRTGIGPAKAYGFGLLSLAPAR